MSHVSNVTPERQRAPRSIGNLLPAVTRQVTPRRGLALGTLLTNWGEIVGPDLARDTAPVRVARGPGGKGPAILHIQVAPPKALEIQHQTAQICERVNAFLGYGAIGRLKLIQEAPVVAQRRRRGVEIRAMTPAEEHRLSVQLDGIGDPALRDALGRLGAAIRGSAP